MDRAIKENQNFLSIPKEEQLKVLEKYATELINSEKPRVDESVALRFQMDAA